MAEHDANPRPDAPRGDIKDQGDPAGSGSGERKGSGWGLRRLWRRPSTLTLVAILFFVGIGLILRGVWVYGDLIVTAGRGTSILILGMGFIIALNVIAILLMLVLLRTIKGRDE